MTVNPDPTPDLNFILRLLGCTLQERTAIQQEHLQNSNFGWENTPTYVKVKPQLKTRFLELQEDLDFIYQRTLDSKFNLKLCKMQFETVIGPYEDDVALQEYHSRLKDLNATALREVILDFADRYGFQAGLLADNVLGTDQTRAAWIKEIHGIRFAHRALQVIITLVLYGMASLVTHALLPWWTLGIIWLLVVGFAPQTNVWFGVVKGTRVDLLVHWGMIMMVLGSAILLPTVFYRGFLVTGLLDTFAWQPIPYTLDDHTPYVLTTPAFNGLIAQSVDSSNIQSFLPDLQVPQNLEVWQGWLQNLAVSSAFGDVKVLRVPTVPGGATWMNLLLLGLPFVSGFYLWGVAFLLMGVGMLWRIPGGLQGVSVLVNWGGLVLLLAIMDCLWPLFF